MNAMLISVAALRHLLSELRGEQECYADICSSSVPSPFRIKRRA